MKKKKTLEETIITQLLNERGANEEAIKSACKYMNEITTANRNGLYDVLDVIEELNAGLDLQWLTAHNVIDINNETERQFDYLIDSQAALIERAKKTLKALIGDDVTGKEKRGE